MLQDFRCIAAHWPFARIDSSQYPDIESFAISSPATPTDQGLSGTTIGMCAKFNGITTDAMPAPGA